MVCNGAVGSGAGDLDVAEGDHRLQAVPELQLPDVQDGGPSRDPVHHGPLDQLCDERAVAMPAEPGPLGAARAVHADVAVGLRVVGS
eukprot:787894-Prorocentrum_minimum.AAC.1